jgi:hypothetical protein
MLWIIGIFVYIVGLFLSVLASVNTSALETSTYWVKVIFWPITIVIYFLGLLIWLLIWLPRKLFKGILLCFYEIKDFFVDVFCSAIDDED